MTRARIITISIIVLTLTQSTIADIYDDAKVIAVSGGEDHTLVLTANKWLWGAGDNYFYQLGIGDNRQSQYFLVRVHDGDINTPSGYLEDINDISAGWTHSLALDVNGCVLAWGYNDQGQIGVNDVSPRYTPARVLGPNGIGFLDGIVAIAAGRSGKHSLALDVNGHCWSWGYGGYGQLGNGQIYNQYVPVQVHAGQQDINNPGFPLAGIVSISGGETHSVAVDINGFVYAWGNNLLKGGRGRLGHGSTVTQENRPVFVHAGEQNSGNPTV